MVIGSVHIFKRFLRYAMVPPIAPLMFVSDRHHIWSIVGKALDLLQTEYYYEVIEAAML